jgi:RecG-like helicase
MILENVKGISESKAEKLNDIHIYTAEQLAMANPCLIEDTPGLSTTNIQNAVKHIGYEDRILDSQQLNYKCGYCKKRMGLNAARPTKMHQEKCERNPESVTKGRYANKGF